MSRINDPHGGALVERVVSLADAHELRSRAAGLPRITLDRREAADLELIASGAASPLGGFMGLRDYQSVLARLELDDGTPWPVPLTLAVSIRQMASALRHEAVALHDPAGPLRAVLKVSDAFVRNAREEALALYGTDDRAHRGVAYLMARPAGTLGGRILVLPRLNGSVAGLEGPRAVRAIARRHGWTSVSGIATLDGSGCIEAQGSASRALLLTPHVAPRGSGGRDAFLQAIVLKNYGAEQVFFEHDRSDWLALPTSITPEELGIAPVWVVPPAPARRRERAVHAAA